MRMETSIHSIWEKWTRQPKSTKDTLGLFCRSILVRQDFSLFLARTIKQPEYLTPQRERVSRFITQKGCKKFSLFSGRWMGTTFFQAQRRPTSGPGRRRPPVLLVLSVAEKLLRFSTENNFLINSSITRRSVEYSEPMFQSIFWLPRIRNTFRQRRGKESLIILSTIMRPSLRSLFLRARGK